MNEGMRPHNSAGGDFERLVIEFCKRNWGEGSVQENRKIGDKESGENEVDVIVHAESEILFIECTIDRSKKKAENDIGKMRLIRKRIFGDYERKPIKGFFVTPQDPSADVHSVADSAGSWICACSFPSFINKFNCSTTYINERRKAAFGSVRNPADDSIEFKRENFVETPFRVEGSGEEVTIDDIIRDIIGRKRSRFTLTGDFGIGKSMTFREIFYKLSDLYSLGKLNRFPIYINLSDSNLDEHDDTVDLIERHARWLGLRRFRDQLVHAWRSDGVILLLDGFDELVRTGFTRLTTSSRDIRYASAHIIRQVIAESPPSTPILISGRQSYFSGFEEMRGALSVKNFAHIMLHDFESKEVRELFRKFVPKSKNEYMLSWLPQRPLLLSYIYFELKESMQDAHDIISPPSPGEGWDSLLDRLSARETRVAKGAEPQQIRRLVERVALYARTYLAKDSSAAREGTVTSLHVANAYRDVFQMEPGLSVQQVLMRLPGLTSGQANEERYFVDRSLFEAAQAGAVVEFIETLATLDRGYVESDSVQPLVSRLKDAKAAISPLSAQVAVSMLKRKGMSGHLAVALTGGHKYSFVCRGNQYADLFMCAAAEPELIAGRGLERIVVREALIPEVEISPELLRGVASLEFHDCIIERLDLAIEQGDISGVRFCGTTVGHLSVSQDVNGFLGETGLERVSVQETEIVDATNSDILAMNIPNHMKVLKIVLRKLFVQSGSGRKKSAFYRGMGGIDSVLVNNCLSTLLRHRVVYVVGNDKSERSNWHPNRIHTKRAMRLIDSIKIPDDVLVKDMLN